MQYKMYGLHKLALLYPLKAQLIIEVLKVPYFPYQCLSIFILCAYC